MMDHLDTLIRHQQWRRGDAIEMLPPEQIGKAIDYAIAVIQAAKQTLKENYHLTDGEQCTLKVLRDAVDPDWRLRGVDRYSDTYPITPELAEQLDPLGALMPEAVRMTSEAMDRVLFFIMTNQQPGKDQNP